MLKHDINMLIKTAQRLAIVILENGGETYRAEEAVAHICNAYNIGEAEVLALPTGVFISVCKEGNGRHSSLDSSDDSISISTVKRVKKRGINLERLDIANDISRALAAKEITCHDALSQLDALYVQHPPHKILIALATFLSAGCFCVLFGGEWFDVVVSGTASAVVQIIAMSFKRINMFRFIISLIGGSVSALFATVFVRIFGIGNISVIISAAIMPLLPGLALVNAIRDTAHGDLVSGMARFGEVLMAALSLAAGVSAVLWFWR